MDSKLILRLEALLSAQGIPPEERKDILQQALLKMVYSWESIDDPEAWLLAEMGKLSR
jgi:hypothetical protein